MFEELIETQPKSAGLPNRRSYFLVSSIVLVVSLSSAIVFSLFAVNLDLDLGDMEMLELLAPVDSTPERKLPEPDIAPKQEAKAKPGPAAAPRLMTRQENIARLDESTQIPDSISTSKSSQKERPADRYFAIGKFDSDGGETGVAGRGPGGNGTGDGLGDGTEVAKVESEAVLPPPPVKKVEPAPKRSLVQSLGVINGRATRLPKPVIPPAAKVAKAAGTVVVQVLVDENGNVISATAVAGNAMLRASAVAAAKSALFNPTTVAGTPVKVSGVINYNFSS